MNFKDSFKSFDAIVFDLDGTLWNACGPCATGWTEGIAVLGYNKPISKADIESVCGLTYPECVRKLCPEVTDAFLTEAMEILNAYERKHVECVGGELYPNVLSGLKEMAQVKSLFLVSNCQEWYLQCFLKFSKTENLFKDWECYGRTMKPKAENLRDLAKRNNLKNALYIGDTEGDKSAASAANYSFGFAAYGFGTAQSEFHFEDFNSIIKAVI